MLAYRRIGVAILTPTDVHLIFCCFLIDRVVKIDAVCVLETPILPNQESPEGEQTNEH